MKASLLEFKIDEHTFGIRTEFIKNIFDIEFVKPVLSMPDYIAGLTKYGNYLSILICLEKLLGLSTKNCKNPLGKFAVSVKVDDSYYSLIVDEIIKIQEVEKKGGIDEPIEFYNIHGEIIEEITPQFLKSKIKIPYLKNFAQKKETEINSRKEDEESFLIFILDDKKFAINTDFIDSIEHLESLKGGIQIKEKGWIEKVFLVKDEVIKAGNLKKLLGWENISTGDTLIIIGENNKSIGILADEIFDILSIKTSSLEKNLDNTDIFKEYFIYGKDVIPVLSKDFIKTTLEKYSIEHKQKFDEKENTQSSNKIDYLIVDILGEKFAIKMEELEEVLDSDNLNISPYITDNPLIKGILALKNKSVFLISFENLFNKNFNKTEESSVIVVNQDNIEVALFVSKIERIESIPEENIFVLDSDTEMIKGSILTKDGDVINILNVLYVKEKIGRE